MESAHSSSAGRSRWQQVPFWEGNTLKRVHVETLVEETLYEGSCEAVPAILHCSTGGWVSFATSPVRCKGHPRQARRGGRMQWYDARWSV